eukprot:4602707-Pyramimonas_sp.AAC.1
MVPPISDQVDGRVQLLSKNDLCARICEVVNARPKVTGVQCGHGGVLTLLGRLTPRVLGGTPPPGAPPMFSA